jgi:protein-tyrosine phosphatase
LRDLIPDGHIDIHSHLLPGIDDGAQNIDDTKLLLDGLRGLGYSEFITTPHVMNGVWENTARSITQKHQSVIPDLPQDLKFGVAAEYMIDSNFTKLFEKQELLTIFDNYVLVEMSYVNPPLHLLDIIFEMQVAGYRPVLAHPERYNFYHSDLAAYEKLKHAGCLFQLNLLSVVGYYGPAVAKTAETLLKKGMFDVAGSDVHHMRHLESFNKKVLIKDLAPLRQTIAGTRRFSSV